MSLENFRMFALKDVLPNPHRQLDRYPVDEESLEKLVESIETSGFTENITGRDTKGGKFEIAAGHARIAALRKIHGPEKQFAFRVEVLDAAQMIQHLARENSTAHKSDMASVMEAIRAAVQAYASGEITQGTGPHQINPVASSKNNSASHERSIRCAPSFQQREFVQIFEPTKSGLLGSKNTYNSSSLAKFLGLQDLNSRGGTQPSERFREAVNALELIEQGFLHEKQLVGLGFMEFQKAVDAASGKRLAKQAELLEAATKKKTVEAEKELKKAAEKTAAATKKAEEKKVAAKAAKSTKAKSPESQRLKQEAKEAAAEARKAARAEKVTKKETRKVLLITEGKNKKVQERKKRQEDADERKRARKADFASLKTQEEKAYKTLAKVFHPDKDGTAEEWRSLQFLHDLAKEAIVLKHKYRNSIALSNVEKT